MRIAEDRLRDGLRELAEEADPNVRAMDVIALVEGRHRQRSIRQLVAACAAVTTAGLLGWFALAPRPVTVQPAPLASAMVRPARAAELAARGLVIHSQVGDATIASPQTVLFRISPRTCSTSLERHMSSSPRPVQVYTYSPPRPASPLTRPGITLRNQNLGWKYMSPERPIAS